MKQKHQTKPEAVLIAEHALFKGLAPQYLALLAETAMVKEFSAGERIFRHGDPANRFYLILNGEVALEEPIQDRGSVCCKRSATTRCSAGRGCFHLSTGTSMRARQSRPRRFFSTAHGFAKAANAIVVNPYDVHLHTLLTGAEKTDLVEYLKSL